jgi:hypothetical protein
MFIRMHFKCNTYYRRELLFEAGICLINLCATQGFWPVCSGIRYLNPQYLIFFECTCMKKTCSLSRFGYALDKSSDQREKALRKATREYGSGYVIKKLVLLRTYRKDTADFHNQYVLLNQDITYVQQWRDAMSASARQKDLEQYRFHFRLKNSNKQYCNLT